MELFPEKRILTVTQLTAIVRGLLEENFDHVWVQGEVSNLGMPASGHLYFTIKDAGAQLRCVMFRGNARALKFRIDDGMGLILRGRLSVYDQRGEYQLIADYAEPAGIGALQMAFVQLKEKLAREGLFGEAHKQALPPLPQRIGVVTSATGAALHDILQVLGRRFANVEILIRPVKVQGEGAAREIAEAIRDFNRYKEIDVMIVGRGGGSLEDLWAFNEEVVARAIYDSKIPIISAVGHEIDFTIADFVADLRAPTPSAAAEMVIRSKEELAAEVRALSHRLVRSMEHLLARRRVELSALTRHLREPSMLLGHLGQRLDDLSGRLSAAFTSAMLRRGERVGAMVGHLRLVNPEVRVERCRERALSLAARMEGAMRKTLDALHERTGVASAELQALSPLKTLGRGYAVARKEGERSAVRDARELSPGERLEILFHRGRAACRVEETS